MADAETEPLTDPAAFTEQYLKVYQRLTLVAAGITGEPQSAEDIVQEAAIVAFRKIEHFIPGTHFAAWMAKIVQGCALNLRQKNRGRRTFATDPAVLAQIAQRGHALDESGPLCPQTGVISPDQTCFDDEVLGCLQLLTPEARSCLLLRVVQQLTYAEISELLQIPEGTAMSHVHRSRIVLRKHMTREAAAEEATGPCADPKVR
jgi:RNA polymerase sigma-70 factor (ECF subfamily)